MSKEMPDSLDSFAGVPDQKKKEEKIVFHQFPGLPKILLELAKKNGDTARLADVRESFRKAPYEDQLDVQKAEDQEVYEYKLGFQNWRGLLLDMDPEKIELPKILEYIDWASENFTDRGIEGLALIPGQEAFRTELVELTKLAKELRVECVKQQDEEKKFLNRVRGRKDRGEVSRLHTALCSKIRAIHEKYGVGEWSDEQKRLAQERRSYDI